MRRTISFLLVLTFCMSLTCVAFAAPVSNVVDSVEASPVSGYTGSNPATGDIIMRWVLIMVLALIALVVVIVLYRKFGR